MVLYSDHTYSWIYLYFSRDVDLLLSISETCEHFSVVNMSTSSHENSGWGHLWLRRPGGRREALKVPPHTPHQTQTTDALGRAAGWKKLEWKSECFWASPLVWWPCLLSQPSAIMVRSRNGRLTSPGGCTKFYFSTSGAICPQERDGFLTVRKSMKQTEFCERKMVCFKGLVELRSRLVVGVLLDIRISKFGHQMAATTSM